MLTAICCVPACQKLAVRCGLPWNGGFWLSEKTNSKTVPENKPKPQKESPVSSNHLCTNGPKFQTVCFYGGLTFGWCLLSSTWGACWEISVTFFPRSYDAAWRAGDGSYRSEAMNVNWKREHEQWKSNLVVYSFSHNLNHGSGKWLYLKGIYYWKDSNFTSMIMGGRVGCFFGGEILPL